MGTILIGLTCLLVGICLGIHLEYRHGYLDRRLHKPWRKPQQAVRNDFIDDCEQFNHEMLRLEVSRRLFVSSETIQ